MARVRGLVVALAAAAGCGLALLLFGLAPGDRVVEAGPAFRPLVPLGPVPTPADNPTTPAKVELGKLLYFDARLSGDMSTSCADCHNPKLGWSDGQDLCRGYPGTSHWRNCQTVVNAGYYAKLFWDGTSTSLEAQARTAATGSVAGNGEEDMMEERLRSVGDYVRRFREVFGDERPEMAHAWKAIAAFERTLVQPDTPLDRYLKGEKEALSAEALKGLALFEGKAGCIRCHDGPLLSDERYHSLGVPENSGFATDPLKTITFRFQHYAKGVPEAVYRKVKSDLGLYYRTKRDEDMGKFRTPTLRYLAHTAPYMHNGAFWTLDEVIDFYDAGGGTEPHTAVFGHPNKSPLLRPLGLSGAEKKALVAFLGALSGPPILVEPPPMPPYVVAE